MSAPKRIQRKRTRGWRAPKGAVYVGRGTKWGNPFRIGGGYQTRGVIDMLLPIEGEFVEGTYDDCDIQGYPITYEVRTVKDAAEAVELFKEYIRDNWWYDRESVGRDLAGRDLMCWCALDAPCHADVLLELANGGEGCG
jgi:hypothetical protein